MWHGGRMCWPSPIMLVAWPSTMSLLMNREKRWCENKAWIVQHDPGFAHVVPGEINDARAERNREEASLSSFRPGREVGSTERVNRWCALAVDVGGPLLLANSTRGISRRPPLTTTASMPFAGTVYRL